MIKQYYGYTDEDNSHFWAEEIWTDHISPLGMEADGPFVQLNSIPTLLGVGCQLISLSEAGVLATENQLSNPLINIAIILNAGHYDILYWRRFGEDTNVFEDLEEEDPVNQPFSHSPDYSADGSFSSQSGDDKDPSHGYTEPPD